MFPSHRLQVDLDGNGVEGPCARGTSGGERIHQCLRFEVLDGVEISGRKGSRDTDEGHVRTVVGLVLRDPD